MKKSTKELDLTIPGSITKTGLTLANNLTLEQWQDVGKRLSVCDAGVHWWIGDWLNYGETKYGETYDRAIEATGFDYQTVRIDKTVAKAVELFRRRNNLSWSHHAEVAPLVAEQQTEWLDKAEQNNWTRQELRSQLKASSHKTKKVEWPKGKYRLIEADPPWQYNDVRTGTVAAGAAVAHYPTMPADDICALPIQELAMPDSVLFLWVTSPLLPDGLRVIESWGFTYKASFVWDKVRGYNGHYNDVQHEFLLVATRGSCVPEINTLPKSIIQEEKTRHSRKPDRFWKIEMDLYPSGPKIELFSRRKREGWDSWGNE